MALERSDVEKTAHLARLGLGESEIPQTTETLNNILGLIDAMQAVDTDGVEPLAHPLEATQRLRAWGALPPPVATPPARPRPPVRDRGTDFPLPQPRIPAPRVPSRMEELPHLARLRHRQQQRRTQAAAV